MTTEATRKVISTDSAPKAIGPYSQAIAAGNLIFCSGQIPLIPSTMVLENADIALQTKRVMSNLKNVLEAAGSSLGKVVKTTCFLTDLKNFEVFNKEYEAAFKDVSGGIYPARSTIQVSALPKGALVEVEALALR